MKKIDEIIEYPELENVKMYIFTLLPGYLFIETMQHILPEDMKAKYIGMDITDGVNKDLLLCAVQNNKLEFSTEKEDIPFDGDALLKMFLIDENILQNDNTPIEKIYKAITKLLYHNAV
jgi:hypothetical protein